MEQQRFFVQQTVKVSKRAKTESQPADSSLLVHELSPKVIQEFVDAKLNTVPPRFALSYIADVDAKHLKFEGLYITRSKRRVTAACNLLKLPKTPTQYKSTTADMSPSAGRPVTKAFSHPSVVGLVLDPLSIYFYSRMNKLEFQDFKKSLGFPKSQLNFAKWALFSTALFRVWMARPLSRLFKKKAHRHLSVLYTGFPRSL